MLVETTAFQVGAFFETQCSYCSKGLVSRHTLAVHVVQCGPVIIIDRGP